VTQTVGDLPTQCANSSDVSFLPGTTLYYCYTIVNTGQVPWSHHSLENNVHGLLFADRALTLAPGQSINTVALGEVISQTLSLSATTVATWTASLDEQLAELDAAQSGLAVVHTAHSVLTMVTPSVQLSITVSPEPGVCTSDTTLAVSPDTQVYFCITLVNHSVLPLVGLRYQVAALGLDVSLIEPLLPGAMRQWSSAELDALAQTVSAPLAVEADLTAGFAGVLGHFNRPSMGQAMVTLVPTALDPTPIPGERRLLLLPQVRRHP
jgi:hypothetical protein